MRKLSFNKPLSHKASPKKYTGVNAWGYSGSSEALQPQDAAYVKHLSELGNPYDKATQKQAAKMAQNETGMSLLTGQRMKNRGFAGGNINGLR